MQKRDAFDTTGFDYDPDLTPDPARWLGLDEGVRMLLARKFHDAAGVRLPKPELHYAMHVVVENQIAEGFPAAANAMRRLQGEGLSRHDALHAIAAVVAQRLFGMLKDGDPQKSQAFSAEYSAELDKLTAQDWYKMSPR